MQTIHWIGTGLSSVPGLRRLIENGHNVIVWNRTKEKAVEAVGDLHADIRTFQMSDFEEQLQKDDVAISMLPGDWHVPIAEACLNAGANFVSSSYISPEMRALDEQAKQNGLTFVNEVGLDPGIDHLMAHWLVADYRNAAGYDLENDLTFRSYCGGIPKIANDFKYKFSWSPLGVLKALRSPSKSMKDFEEYNVQRPWDAVDTYIAPLPEAESFEVYPNRDSLPFIEDYAFDDNWRVKTFVRGTLRLNGWAEAWDPIFKEIETLKGAEGEERLKEMSDQFWQEHAFDEGEPDRVVMFVELKAEKDGQANYHKTYVMDAWGDDRGNAMARLVSVPVSLAVETVLDKKLPSGVFPAPSDLTIVETWMGHVKELAQHLDVVDHLKT